ncbi:hypothetical protein Vretimale_7752, partial [Volvox reticuliferus]
PPPPRPPVLSRSPHSSPPRPSPPPPRPPVLSRSPHSSPPRPPVLAQSPPSNPLLPPPPPPPPPPGPLQSPPSHSPLPIQPLSPPPPPRPSPQLPPSSPLPPAPPPPSSPPPPLSLLPVIAYPPAQPPGRSPGPPSPLPPTYRPYRPASHPSPAAYPSATPPAFPIAEPPALPPPSPSTYPPAIPPAYPPVYLSPRLSSPNPGVMSHHASPFPLQPMSPRDFKSPSRLPEPPSPQPSGGEQIAYKPPLPPSPTRQIRLKMRFTMASIEKAQQVAGTQASAFISALQKVLAGYYGLVADEGDVMIEKPTISGGTTSNSSAAGRRRWLLATSDNTVEVNAVINMPNTRTNSDILTADLVSNFSAKLPPDLIAQYGIITAAVIQQQATIDESPPPPLLPPENDTSKSKNVGAIVGGTLGGVAGAVLLIFAAIKLKPRVQAFTTQQKRRRQQSDQTTPLEDVFPAGNVGPFEPPTVSIPITTTPVAAADDNFSDAPAAKPSQGAGGGSHSVQVVATSDTSPNNGHRI